MQTNGRPPEATEIALADDLIEGMKAICDETGFTLRQGYHYSEKGMIPVFRIGRKIYARRSQLKQRLSAPAV